MSHDKLPSGYVRARKEAEETVTKRPAHCEGLLNHFLLVCPEMAPPETIEQNMQVGLKGSTYEEAPVPGRQK